MEDTLDKGGAKGRFDPREVRAANCLLRGIRNAETPTSLSQASQPPVASDSRFNWTSTTGKTSFCLTCLHLYNMGQLCCALHDGRQHRGPCTERDQGSLNLGM